MHTKLIWALVWTAIPPVATDRINPLKWQLKWGWLFSIYGPLAPLPQLGDSFYETYFCVFSSDHHHANLALDRNEIKTQTKINAKTNTMFHWKWNVSTNSINGLQAKVKFICRLYLSCISVSLAVGKIVHLLTTAEMAGREANAKAFVCKFDTLQLGGGTPKMAVWVRCYRLTTDFRKIHQLSVSNSHWGKYMTRTCVLLWQAHSCTWGNLSFE